MHIVHSSENYKLSFYLKGPVIFPAVNQSYLARFFKKMALRVNLYKDCRPLFYINAICV